MFPAESGAVYKCLLKLIDITNLSLFTDKLHFVLHRKLECKQKNTLSNRIEKYRTVLIVIRISMHIKYYNYCLIVITVLCTDFSILNKHHMYKTNNNLTSNIYDIIKISNRIPRDSSPVIINRGL